MITDLFSRDVSQGVREFCAAMIANPHDWRQERYEFVNVKNPDIRVWTCNGLAHIQIHGNDGLTRAEKKLILKAVNLTTARRLTTPPTP